MALRILIATMCAGLWACAQQHSTRGRELTVGDAIATATPMALARGAASKDLQRRLPITGQRRYIELVESNKAVSGDAFHMGCLGGDVLQRAVPETIEVKAANLLGKEIWMVVALDLKGVPTQAFLLTEQHNKYARLLLGYLAMRSTYVPCQFSPDATFSGPIVVLYEFDQQGNLLPQRNMVDLGISRDTEQVFDENGKKLFAERRELYLQMLTKPSD